MSIEKRLRVAIGECQEKLKVIEGVMREEMAKPVLEWRQDLLAFLRKEKEVYAFALAQLESLLVGESCNEKSSE